MFATPVDNPALDIPEEIEDREAAEALLRIFMNWTRGSPNHRSREMRQTQCRVELDSRTFIKMLKQAHLIPQAFSLKDADLAFTVAKQKSTKLTFPMFLFAVFVLAEKHGCEVRDYLGNLVEYCGDGPAYVNISSESIGGSKDRGPARFFYDANSYTGAHKQGGPSTRTAGEGYTAGFSSLISRDHVQDDSIQRRKFGGNMKSGSNKKGAIGGAARYLNQQIAANQNQGGQGVGQGQNMRDDLKAKSGERQSLKDSLEKTFAGGKGGGGGPGSVTGGGPGAGGNFEVKFPPRVVQQQPKKKSEENNSNNSRPNTAPVAPQNLKGPEKFFYDKSTYTGAHTGKSEGGATSAKKA